jgi:hypothetical protein
VDFYRGRAAPKHAEYQLPDVVLLEPSAHDAPMTRHTLPRLLHPSKAACRPYVYL